LKEIFCKVIGAVLILL